jgi:hypothetical protein
MKILMACLNEENKFMPNFYQYLDLIQRFSIPINEGEEKDNSKFIYIEQYKFYRFDNDLIEFISTIYKFDYFYTVDFDERFIDTKYYNIETKDYEYENRRIIQETLTITPQVDTPPTLY